MMFLLWPPEGMETSATDGQTRALGIFDFRFLIFDWAAGRGRSTIAGRRSNIET